MNTLKIGIAGLGTVGSGVVKLLEKNKDTISKRCGRNIEIVAVSARNKDKDRGINLSKIQWVDNSIDIANLDLDIVVELIGGMEGTPKKLCETALRNGKSVVTANKALIAKHGMALSEIAMQNNTYIAFEAAVAGGIPILKAIREGLAGNSISCVVGILNGTCNYILTTMQKSGREFADVLKEAQDLGYAEADPEFDIEGIDAAHKLAILTSLSFGSKLSLENIYIDGITGISPLDIKYAGELGYNIKLVGIARKVGDKIEQRVHPVLVAKNSFLANVDGAFNAVSIEGDAIGNLLLEGPGAGEMATASAVVADIIDIARGNKSHPFNVAYGEMKDVSFIDIEDVESSYYLRIPVVDKAGVLKEISKTFAHQGISIGNVIQKQTKDNNSVDVILTTHITREIDMKKALGELETLSVVIGKPHIIRVL